jgi:hypothetical protein
MTDRQFLDLSRRCVIAARGSGRRMLAAAGLGAGLVSTVSRARAQADPSPTPGIGQIAPQPSPTPPSSVPPTPTMGTIIQPPTPTATAEPERVDPTQPPPSPPSPTPTQPSIVQAEPEGDAEQTVPCPTPFSPFDWFCWPGSGGRWVPVIPQGDFAQQIGIAAYGIRMRDVGDPDWQLEAIAWDAQGTERGRTSWEIEMDVFVGRFASGARTLEIRFLPEVAADGAFSFSGETNGQPFATAARSEGEFVGAATTVRLATEEEEVLRSWIPLFAELDGLLSLTTPDGGELEGPGKCAVMGFFAGIGCLGAATAGIAGYFICADNLGNAIEACG